MRMLSKYKSLVGSVFAWLWLGGTLVACSHGYRIEGNSSITSLDGKMMIIKAAKGMEWVSIDSAEVVHGCFCMEGRADTARVVTLYLNNEPLMPLVIESAGTIRVDITPSKLTAQGTPLNDKLYDFIDRRNKMETALAELDRKEARLVLDGRDIDEVRAELQAEGIELTDRLNDCVKSFITDNFENPLGPSVFMMLCSSLPYPVMTPLIEELMLTAPQTFKQDAMVKDFLEKAKENKELIEEQQRMAENRRVQANQR